MRIIAVLSVASLLFLSGCAHLLPAHNAGNLFADYSYPGYYNGVTNKGPGGKMGNATAQSILGWVALGDASVATACKNGGINTIHTVDHHMRNILGIYAEWTTKVTGE